MLCDDEFRNGYAADQVLGDDALQRRRGTRAVPHSFGVDDGDGSVLANTQTVGFGTVDLAVLRKVEFGEALL